MTATSRHEKRQKKGRQQQQQQQRKGNTPELDDAGTGNPRRLGSLMRGMRLASAITAASSLSLSLSLSFSEPQAIRSLFFLLKHNGRPDVTSNWHRQVKLIRRGLAGVSPAFHSVRTQILFLRSQNGLYQRAITPGVQIRSLIVSAVEFCFWKIQLEGRREGRDKGEY